MSIHARIVDQYSLHDQVGQSQPEVFAALDSIVFGIMGTIGLAIL